MTSRRLDPRLETRAWLRTVGRPGPERWVWPVALAAWAVLAWATIGPEVSGSETRPGHHHHVSRTPPDPSSLSAATVAGHLWMWSVMVAATMLPLIAWNLRSVGLRSPRARRRTATLVVAAGWAGVWLVAGAILLLGLALAQAVSSAAVTVVVVCGLAVAWQLTEVKRVAIARCHRSFAPPLGRAAKGACLRFGRTLGRDCLLGCWAGMTLMSVAGHHLAVVAPLAWLSWRDRRRPHDRPGTGVSVVVLLGTGAIALLVV